MIIDSAMACKCDVELMGTQGNVTRVSGRITVGGGLHCHEETNVLETMIDQQIQATSRSSRDL
jgi:hypothetical protein